MNTIQPIDKLNAISPGWTCEGVSPDELLCNPNAGGGIIDFWPIGKTWFVIFNDSRVALDGFKTRADAIDAFVAWGRAS